MGVQRPGTSVQGGSVREDRHRATAVATRHIQQYSRECLAPRYDQLLAEVAASPPASGTPVPAIAARSGVTDDR